MPQTAERHGAMSPCSVRAVSLTSPSPIDLQLLSAVISMHAKPLRPLSGSIDSDGVQRRDTGGLSKSLSRIASDHLACGYHPHKLVQGDIVMFELLRFEHVAPASLAPGARACHFPRRRRNVLQVRQLHARVPRISRHLVRARRDVRSRRAYADQAGAGQRLSDAGPCLRTPPRPQRLRGSRGGYPKAPRPPPPAGTPLMIDQLSDDSGIPAAIAGAMLREKPE